MDKAGRVKENPEEAVGEFLIGTKDSEVELVELLKDKAAGEKPVVGEAKFDITEDKVNDVTELDEFEEEEEEEEEAGFEKVKEEEGAKPITVWVGVGVVDKVSFEGLVFAVEGDEDNIVVGAEEEEAAAVAVAVVVSEVFVFVSVSVVVLGAVVSELVKMDEVGGEARMGVVGVEVVGVMGAAAGTGLGL